MMTTYDDDDDNPWWYWSMIMIINDDHDPWWSWSIIFEQAKNGKCDSTGQWGHLFEYTTVSLNQWNWSTSDIKHDHFHGSGPIGWQLNHIEKVQNGYFLHYMTEFQNG